MFTGKVDDLKGTLFNFNLATRAPQFFSLLNWATNGRTADLVVPTAFPMPDGEAGTEVGCGGAFSAVLLGASRPSTQRLSRAPKGLSAVPPPSAAAPDARSQLTTPPPLPQPLAAWPPWAAISTANWAWSHALGRP